jgi:hypothetical protein
METVSNVTATLAANPTIVGGFATKDLPYTPTVIEAALSLVSQMKNQGIFMTSEARALGYLLPPSVESATPLHVITMNDMAGLELSAFALQSPYFRYVRTVDKLHRHTFVWFGWDDEPSAALSAAQCWEVGPVLRLFLTPTRALLVYDKTGEEGSAEHYALICKDSDYDTGSLGASSEITEAEHDTRQIDSGGGAFDFAEHHINLVACTFEKAQLTCQNFLVPGSFPTERYLHPVEPSGLKAMVRYRAENGTYVLDNTVSYMSTRIEVCTQVARAIAIKCIKELQTINVSHSKQEILELYFEQAQLLRKVTRAEACWAVCRAAEQLDWHSPKQIIEELRTYRD